MTGRGAATHGRLRAGGLRAEEDARGGFPCRSARRQVLSGLRRTVGRGGCSGRACSHQNVPGREQDGCCAPEFGAKRGAGRAPPKGRTGPHASRGSDAVGRPGTRGCLVAPERPATQSEPFQSGSGAREPDHDGIDPAVHELGAMVELRRGRQCVRPSTVSHSEVGYFHCGSDARFMSSTPWASGCRRVASNPCAVRRARTVRSSSAAAGPLSLRLRHRRCALPARDQTDIEKARPATGPSSRKRSRSTRARSAGCGDSMRAADRVLKVPVARVSPGTHGPEEGATCEHRRC